MLDEEDRETGYALFLAIALAIVVSIFTIGIAAGTAIGQLGKKPSDASAAALPVAAAPATSSAATADRSMVKLYFELGKAELPADAVTQLGHSRRARCACAMPCRKPARSRRAGQWSASRRRSAARRAA